MCSGIDPCWACNGFWEAVPDDIVVVWVCFRCADRENLRLLGYYGAGRGAPWEDDEEKTPCDICGRNTLVLQAAETMNE